MNRFSMTAHAQRVVTEKGFNLEDIQAVWEHPTVTYPSQKHPHQHKRVGRGLCLACEPDGKVVTVFVDRETTPLRADQQRDREALKWARRNGFC